MAIASATEGWSLARHVLTFCGSDEGQHVWEEEGNKFYAEPSLLTAATSLNLLTFERGAEISQGRGGYQVVGQFETRRHPTSPPQPCAGSRASCSTRCSQRTTTGRTRWRH